MTPALYAGFAVMLVVSSLLVILHKNPVTSALFLVLAFCSLAGIYLVLQAEFIGMVQILVYAGAIMVLFLFVIMYLNLGRDTERGVQIVFRRVVGWLIGITLVVEGAILIGRGWSVGPITPETFGERMGNTQALGRILYSRYLFPFEITSILLLVAMVGAVVIARGRVGLGGPTTGARAARLARDAAAVASRPAPDAVAASGAAVPAAAQEPVPPTEMASPGGLA